VKGAKLKKHPKLALAQIFSAVDIISNLKDYLLFRFWAEMCAEKAFILKHRRDFVAPNGKK
jgi:hypothetical protein